MMNTFATDFNTLTKYPLFCWIMRLMDSSVDFCWHVPQRISASFQCMQCKLSWYLDLLV